MKRAVITAVLVVTVAGAVFSFSGVGASNAKREATDLDAMQTFMYFCIPSGNTEEELKQDEEVVRSYLKAKGLQDHADHVLARGKDLIKFRKEMREKHARGESSKRLAQYRRFRMQEELDLAPAEVKEFVVSEFKKRIEVVGADDEQ